MQRLREIEAAAREYKRRVRSMVVADAHTDRRREAVAAMQRTRVRAICSASSIHATHAARSAVLGCASSSGGLSSASNCFRIISQCRTSLSGTDPSK